MSFHVTELARVTSGPMGSDSSCGDNGAFDIESREPGWRLAIIASDGSDDAGVPEALGWEHVSVHAYKARPASDWQQPPVRQRTPTWKEMAFIKGLFWDDEDVVMQLHPQRSQYVNNHPNVLHLWRSRLREIPTPPAILVGVLESGKAVDAVDPVAGGGEGVPHATQSSLSPTFLGGEGRALIEQAEIYEQRLRRVATHPEAGPEWLRGADIIRGLLALLTVSGAAHQEAEQNDLEARIGDPDVPPSPPVPQPPSESHA